MKNPGKNNPDSFGQFVKQYGLTEEERKTIEAMLQNRGRMAAEAAMLDEISEAANNAATEEKARRKADEIIAILDRPDRPEEKTQEIDVPSGEEQNSKISRLMEKARKSRGFKVLVGAMAGVVLAASLFGGFKLGRTSNNIPEAPSYAATQTVESTSNNEVSETKELTGYEILDKMIDGSFSQYNNPGCHGDEETSPTAVGNPSKILEIMGVDPENASAEERGAVQEYLAYSMVEPAAAVARAGGFSGFEGLSQEEAEEKIRNMSQEEKDALQDQLKGFFDKTEYHYEIGKGTYNNQIIEKGPNGETRSRVVRSDLTGVRILVAVTTLEDGTKVRWMAKEDCGNWEDRIVVERPGQEPIIVKLTPPEPDKPVNSVPPAPDQPNKEKPETPKTPPKTTPDTPTPDAPTPDTPTPDTPTPDTPTPTPPPPETPHTPKDPAQQIASAGKYASQEGVGRETTEGENDNYVRGNLESIEDREADEEAEAERVRAEQEAAEHRATKEAAERRAAEERAAAELSAEEAAAEAKRQAAAEEAAARATEEAAETQRRAAEAERRAAEEQAAREAAQAAADKAAATAAEDKARGDEGSAGAEERANMFENGDF